MTGSWLSPIGPETETTVLVLSYARSIRANLGQMTRAGPTFCFYRPDSLHHHPRTADKASSVQGWTLGVDRVHFLGVRVWSFEYKSRFEYKSSIRIEFLGGLSLFPKVLLSLAQTNCDPTEYMKLPEKCELSNLFYKATFHFRLDFGQTRLATRL